MIAKLWLSSKRVCIIIFKCDMVWLFCPSSILSLSLYISAEEDSFLTGRRRVCSVFELSCPHPISSQGANSIFSATLQKQAKQGSNVYPLPISTTYREIAVLLSGCVEEKCKKIYIFRMRVTRFYVWNSDFHCDAAPWANKSDSSIRVLGAKQSPACLSAAPKRVVSWQSGLEDSLLKASLYRSAGKSVC